MGNQSLPCPCGKKQAPDGEKKKTAAERLAGISAMLRPKRLSLGTRKSWEDRVGDVSHHVGSVAGRATFGGRYKRIPQRLENDYEVDRETILGTGYNGAVVLARSRRTNARFAIKSFPFNKTDLGLLESEAGIFLSLDHPNVARLHDIYEDETHLHLVMECMEGGCVLERLLKKKTYRECDATLAVWQMLLAVNYIHSRGVVHKDLKLQNFMYKSETDETLTLIDFGFSQVWDQSKAMDRCCGTLAYSAPEVLNGSYTSLCDLWSLGVITYVLLVGHMPFSGDDETMTANIKAGAYRWREECWKHISAQAIDFVKKLLVVDTRERLDAQSAMSHPWMSKSPRGAPRKKTVDLAVVGALCNFAKAPQFRRACMLMMAWSLSEEERAKVCDVFLAADESRQGTITLKELQNVLERNASVTDELVRPIFEALDASQNNEILYTEFLAAMVSTRIEMHDGLLESAFKRLDVDSSGFITVENLRDVFGDSFSGLGVDGMIQEGDLTKDGRISYPEFLEYLKGDWLERSNSLQGIMLRQVSSAKSVGTNEPLERVSTQERIIMSI